MRPGNGWELIFKCGIPCPNHLPPHVHSDQLSFELYYLGDEVIVEAGTSVYEKGLARSYERSGAAHNVLQLGEISNSGEIKWIEPVEVWDSFRAGRKARPVNRCCGTLAKGGYFAEGSHDGYYRHGGSHQRRIELSDASHKHMQLELIDTVTTKRRFAFQIWWHLGPQISESFLKELQLNAPTALAIKSEWAKTWLATGFGQRRSRCSYYIHGILPPGHHQISSRLSIPATLLHKSEID